MRCLISTSGVYQCGPASVKAIKNGEVYLPHDTKFVFAEVNGDRVRWDVKADGSMEPTIVNARSVGKAISTKAVGADTREDLTLEYKYPEGWSVYLSDLHVTFQSYFPLVLVTSQSRRIIPSV